MTLNGFIILRIKFKIENYYLKRVSRNLHKKILLILFMKSIGFFDNILK